MATERPRASGRSLWLSVALSCLGAVACSEDDGTTTSTTGTSTPATSWVGAGDAGSTTGSTGTTGSTETTGSNGSTGEDTGTPPGDADGGSGPGTTTGGSPDAGSTGDGGASTGADPDAGADAASPDADVGGGSDADVDGGDPEAGLDAGPEAGSEGGADAGGPVDYAMPGPHEVTIEENVGEAFRNDVEDDTARCEFFIALAGGSDAEVDEELTSYPEDMDRGLYTLFRPAQLEEGVKYPVITWGNGTCAQPRLYTELLEHLASHGFIVIASNWRWVGDGQALLGGLEFVLSENEDPESPLYGKVDTEMLGASGHSQGSQGSIAAGADPRIVATVPIQGASAAGVRDLNGPTFLIAGEEDDIVAPSGIESAFQAATVPAAYGLSLGQGHLMPGTNPTPILDAVTAWFRIHLANDDQARELFYGDMCDLCDDSRWDVQRMNL